MFQFIFMSKSTQSVEMVILEDETEVQQTKAYGIGIDRHSKFIQVSVYVKCDLKFFEYRHEFATDWNFLIQAKFSCRLGAVKGLGKSFLSSSKTFLTTRKYAPDSYYDIVEQVYLPVYVKPYQKHNKELAYILCIQKKTSSRGEHF